MTADNSLDDEPFDFRQTKGGLAQISCRGKVVTTLAGREADKFLAKANGLESRDLQLLMAKATGHFKHGTERVAKNRAKGN